MIPSGVAAIAELIHPEWQSLPEDAEREVLAAAWRIYNADIWAIWDVMAKAATKGKPEDDSL